MDLPKLQDKRKRVLSWALDQVTDVVNGSTGWTSSEWSPSHDAIVLGFVAWCRTAYLMRHKGGGFYDILSEQDIWFDDPPERAVNLVKPEISHWKVVPVNVYE